MQYLNKSFSVYMGGNDNYDKIFSEPAEKPKNTKIVDKSGREIKLSSPQKNEMYRNAKLMREKLQDRLCTKSECWNPTDKNCDKMINSEFKSRDIIDKFVKTMKAIGADPKDYDVERLRRRR